MSTTPSLVPQFDDYIKNNVSETSCASWCKCVQCRTRDFKIFQMMNENCDNLMDWIDNATEKLASIKHLYNYSIECLKEVQDKYAPESFENEERFINGVSVEIVVPPVTDNASDSKDKID